MLRASGREVIAVRSTGWPGASAVGCDGRNILVWGLRVRYPYRRLKGVTTFGGVMPFLTAMMLSATAMPMRRFVS